MNAYDTADQHGRIESGPNDTVELKEYSRGTKVGVITSFDNRNEAREYFESEDFDYPLVDLHSLDVSTPLPGIQTTDEDPNHTVEFNNQPIAAGDVLVNISNEYVGRIRLAVEVTDAGIVSYGVDGTGEGEYGWIPAEWLHEDINAKTEDAITVVKNGYETLMQNMSPIPQRSATPSEIAKEIKSIVEDIDQHYGEDPEQMAYALDSLRVSTENLNGVLNPTDS